MKTSLFLAVGVFGLASIGPGRADPAERPALIAKLENARTQGSGPPAIHVDFVLVNQSTGPVRIAECWNSFGAHQWTIQLADAKGTVFEFANPQVKWKKNFLTVAVIEPGKEHRSKCLLTYANDQRPDSPDTVIFWPVEASRDAFQAADFSGPVSLTGTFAAKQLFDDEVKKVSTNWTGKAVTKKLTITPTKPGP